MSILNDFIEDTIDNRGRNPKYYDHEKYPVIDNVLIKNFIYPDINAVTRFIDEDTYQNFLRGYVHKNMPIMTLVGSGIGNVSLAPNDKVAIVQNTIGFLVKNNADEIFLYYYLLGNQERIRNYNRGSGQPSVRKTDILGMEVNFPDIDTQKRIAIILFTIDTKIQNNIEINENLLQQARALFKSWFVDFDPFDEPMTEAPTGYQIPQSLKMVQIQDLPHILETGKRPKGGAVSEGIPSVGAENVKQLGVFDSSSAKFIPRDFAMSMKKGKIEGYELLLYKDGGKPGTFTPHFSMFGEGFPYEEFYINEHVFKLDFNDRGYNEFVYLYMQTDYPYHWLANNGGKAAIPGINQQNVNDIWIYHPSHPLVQEFCKWVQPLFTTIFTNCAENMKLSKLRDTLLPKLMSGELDVSSLDL